MKAKIKYQLIFLFLMSYSVFAGVNLKNGNYYVSYTDIDLETFQSAFESITRTYNSKSTEIGIFGYGWGSDLETRLKAYPDGSILIKENGSGGNTYYKSLLVTDDMTEIMIDDLIDVLLSQGVISNAPNAIIERRNKLLNNLEYRQSQWDKYVEKGLLGYALDYPVGMDWESHHRGNSKLVKTETGYLRVKNGENETFDIDGNLIKLDKGNGIYSILEYDDNRLTKIIGADGKELIFKLNKDGFVISITSEIGNSEYVYDGKKLIETKDVVTNIFKHTYDTNYNMTSISYEDDSTYTIEYQPKTSYVNKITDRNGDVVEYNYVVYYKEDGAVDGNHYATSVTKEGYGGSQVTNYYEYVIGVKANGETYSKMIKTKVNEITTETHYDELCNNPISITRGQHKTIFKYNNRCLLTEKLSTRGDSIYLKYHPRLEKIIYVKDNNSITEFEYDDKGNLTKAEKNDGKWIKLSYDDKGRINTMKQNGKVLNFIYNAYGKPIKITMKKVGNIDITYDEYGEIDTVNSEDGHEMALKVTQAFQNMLSLVKPAGVNLGI